MRFRKGSLVVVSTSPICDSLYLRQGWVPVEDAAKPAVAEESVAAEAPSLTAKPAPVIDEPITQIEDGVKEEVKEPAVKAKTTKTTSVKSTTQKRTYQKHK